MTRKVWEPREYQTIAREFLVNHDRAALWASMGMGKTVSTATAFDDLILSGETTRPALVCGPLRVARKVWPSDIAKWQHLRHIELVPIIGSATERHRRLFSELAKGNASMFSINYEGLPWLAEEFRAAKMAWPFGTVIADESTKVKSTRIKQGSVRGAVLRNVVHKHVDRVWELTGTPAPNGLKDLWGQIYLMDGGKRLGATYEAFMQRWFQHKYDGYGVEPVAGASAEIHARLADICLTLDAKDWFDLEEPIINIIRVDLPSGARRLYRDMEKQMFLEIEGDKVEAFNAASRTIKCLQLANGAIYTDEAGAWKEVHRAKIDALEDVVEEAAGMPVLVVYYFKSDLARLQAAFPKGREYKTDADEDDWNAGKIPVMFIHPGSAGHGVNLQDGSNIVAVMSHDWNLENYLQVIERIGPVRQLQSGHMRPVFIHWIVAEDTVDEAVIASRTSKKTTQDALLEYCKRKAA